jgi:phosphoribosylanthranilate isomerase
MPLKALVKVSKISNLSDARYCAGMGVNMLGFRTIPGQEHYMPPEIFQDIRGWLSGPKIVAELYGVSSAAQIDFIMLRYAPDYFELTYQEYLSVGKFLSLPCLVHFPEPESLVEKDKDSRIHFTVADEDTQCQDITGSRPVLVKVKNVDSLLKKLSEGCFKGFVLEAPQESRPGITSYDELGTILEALDVD